MDKCIGFIIEKEGCPSLEEQKSQLLEFAQENGYELLNFIEEKEVTGDSKKISNILRDKEIVAPYISAILIMSNTLITSNARQYFYYLFLFYKKGIDLIPISEELDIDRMAVNRFKSILMFMADKEKNILLTRTSKSRLSKASNGGYAGGLCPLGYRVENGKLIVDEEEAKIVREIFRLRKFNVSFVGIARYLNSNGFRTRRGKEFSQPGLYAIVNNKKFYQGYYRYGESGWVKGIHKPIIDEDEE